MVPHGADVAVYVRGALVGFCGLTTEGKAWIKTNFIPPEPYQDVRTVWADWRSAQRTIGALSEAGLACLIDSA